MKQLDMAASAVFLAALITYVQTLCPTVYTGDSGDFITASYTYGVAHPGGYPLYMIIGKIFSLIPIGSIAYRYNLMSALFAASTAVIIYWMVKKLTENTEASVFAGLMVAFSKSIWDQATIAEAYVMNGFFIAATTYLLIIWRKDKNQKTLLWAATVVGFGITNHLSTIFYLPAFAYLVYEKDKKIVGKIKEKLALHFFTPLILYLYIPIASLMNPPYNWMKPDTINRFLAHVTGSVHRQTYVMTLPKQVVFERFWGLIAQMSTQFWVVGIFALVGIYTTPKKHMPILKFSAILAICDLGYALFLNDVSIQITAFMIPTTVIIGIWGGFGFKNILEKTKTKNFALIACILFSASVFGANYYASDRSENLIAYDFSNNIIKTIQYDMERENLKQTVIFAQGDNIVFPLYYLTLVEKVDPNIKVYEQTGQLSHGLYGVDYFWLDEKEKRERKEKIEKEVVAKVDAVYFLTKPEYEIEGYRLDEQGLVYRFVKNDRPYPAKNYWELYDYRQVWNTTIELDYMTKQLKSVYYIKFAQYHLSIDSEKSLFLLGKALELIPENGEIRYDIGNILLGQNQNEKAIDQFISAINLDMENPKYYNNLGYAYTQNGEIENAQRAYENALIVRPDYLTARRNLAKLLLNNGKLNLALKQYIILESVEENPDNTFNIGLIYFRSGEKEKAKIYWNKYLELESTSENAQKIKIQFSKWEEQSQND